MGASREEDLVRENLDLVRVVARQLTRDLGLSKTTTEDVESAGREGLFEAARRFDPERGVAFRKYATYRIKGAMYDALRRESSLPRRVYEKLRALEAASVTNEAALEELGAPPAPGTTAATLDARLADHLAALATAMATGLVASTVVEDEEPVAVDGALLPDERIARAEMRQRLQGAIKTLPDGERELVEGHYYGGRRFDEVAQELGMSKSWASRLHKRAMGRLQQALR